MRALGWLHVDSVRVLTTAGVVEGASDGSFVSFLGIPYGAPTDGVNRFRPPLPPHSWPGVRHALTWGQRSPQTTSPDPLRQVFPRTFDAVFGDTPAPDIPMSEDCLTVNIWAPAASPDAPRPVLFWLHGGGSSGAAADPRTDGTALAFRGNVVVVSVTHRLNVFGYLYLGGIAGDDYRSSGGVGHLDLVAALEWVHDNISSFGGDPKNVTIFGESAGGSKAACLMVMPRPRRALP